LHAVVRRQAGGADLGWNTGDCDDGNDFDCEEKTGSKEDTCEASGGQDDNGGSKRQNGGGG
jgi:hypothetical protein